MSGSEAVTIRISESLERLSAPILFVSLFLTIFLSYTLTPLPAFTTDLESFAPETDADGGKMRIETALGASPNLIYINVEANASGNEVPNILEMGALHQLAEDHARVGDYSLDHGGVIISQINAAGILQRFLEERNHTEKLADFKDWDQMLSAVLENEECGDAVGSDERNIATAAFASSAMLHRDLDYEPVCNWLESGEGNPTPRASSTLWLVELDGNLSNQEKQTHAKGIRDLLDRDSILEYGVISDGLISSDINESTLDNLVWLMFLAVMVVVILLALAFRSITMVAAPLIALLASLVWTYGIVNLAGMRFSVLEIAVAPVVLGLGIDYSIHLQRGYERAKEDSNSSAEAWVKSFMELRVALLLAVITTVFAFLANSFSPLPPLRTFGITLALGVVSAFVASTVTVGAMHVFVERTIGASRNRGWSSKVWPMGRLNSKGQTPLLCCCS